MRDALLDFVYDPPQEPYLSIIYHDDAIVVVAKPAGLLSVRGRKAAHQDSVQQRLEWIYPEIRANHRLDMATSGILLFSHGQYFCNLVNRQFADKRTAKTYIARVIGHLEADHGLIDQPLIVDWPNRPMQKICQSTGKPSQTKYRVLARDKHSTLVELTPITGRSHQLRVHMQFLGHPILGDRLYSERESWQGVSRLHLHAQDLGFYHPQNEQWVTYHLPHPFAHEDEFAR